MPIFTEFKAYFPSSESLTENKQTITLGLSALFIIGLVVYLVMKNKRG